MKALALWFAAPLALACSPSTSTPARVDPMTIDPPASASGSFAAGGKSPGRVVANPADAVVGEWEGAPCEGRAYVRRVAFEPDGSFLATDRVAPCPPGASCMWSGILLWKGAWNRDGTRVVLAADRSIRVPDQIPDVLLLSGEGPSFMTEEAAPSCRYLPSR